MSIHQHTIERSIRVHASAATVWTHITEVDLASFRHPWYFVALGIPKPLRAEIDQPGRAGRRTEFFANGRRFLQAITEWEPNQAYAFTFGVEPGFRVAHVLDLGRGPFRIKAGAYGIVQAENCVQLSLASGYELRGELGALLHPPVRLVLSLFQRSLPRGIKANAERPTRNPAPERGTERA